MKTIEIVVPCFNEQECVRPLYDAISNTMGSIDNYDFSILYVNDGSRDGTLRELRKLRNDVGDKVNYISFARNFGKESAIYAGLSNSTGDLVVLMDADLQHPPELIPEMIKGIEEGYDVCGARRVNRSGEPPIRSFFSKMFYKFINKVTIMNLVQGGSDYRMMTRQVVDAMMELNERERFTKGIMSWVGFETKWIEYENVERLAGESKWSFAGLAHYAINGFVGYATAPLRAVIWFGVVIVLVSVIYAVYIFVSTMISSSPRTGFSTIIILLLLIGGMIIGLLGVIGEYIARIYLELKHRPIYIAKENTLNDNEKKETESNE